MNLDFDVQAIKNEIANKYVSKLDTQLQILKTAIDIRTPVLTWDLVAHNKVQSAGIYWNEITWWVYNDLGDYEFDVEDWMWIPLNYHNKAREVMFRQEWAKMFTDGLKAYEDILIRKLNE